MLSCLHNLRAGDVIQYRYDFNFKFFKFKVKHVYREVNGFTIISINDDAYFFEDHDGKIVYLIEKAR